MNRREIQIRPPVRGGHPVPTGMDLVALIRRQGIILLATTTRDAYLAEKHIYLELLEIADHDQIAGPLIARDVQTVLDEESARFRQRMG